MLLPSACHLSPRCGLPDDPARCRCPNEAVGLSSEYSISGSAVDEFMTMGINDSNEYTMESKFLDEGAWNGTPVLPVSDLRNQEVNLVFALKGVSAPPIGTLGVRNIQFYIPPRPQLKLEKSGNTLIASWPLFAIWTIETSIRTAGKR